MDDPTSVKLRTKYGQPASAQWHPPTFSILFSVANMRRILLSEGSSLSARETITALGLAGRSVELLQASPGALAGSPDS